VNIDSLCTHLSALYTKNTSYYFRLAYGSSPNVEDVFVSDSVINTALNYMLGWKVVQYGEYEWQLAYSHYTYRIEGADSVDKMWFIASKHNFDVDFPVRVYTEDLESVYRVCGNIRQFYDFGAILLYPYGDGDVYNDEHKASFITENRINHVSAVGSLPYALSSLALVTLIEESPFWCHKSYVKEQINDHT